ncbi:lytic transglycosylase domain-containing protein [Desulfocastanea catecholica]
MQKSLKILVATLLWLVLSASSGHAIDVVLPLTLDHSLLTSLLRHNFFLNEEQSAEITGKPGDCTYVRISEPNFSAAEKLLRLEVKLDIKVGTKLGETCLAPLEWHGYLELLQQPIFDGQTFALSFQTVDSRLLTLSRTPATIAGILWEFAKPRVYAHLERLHLDLAPPVSELRFFLERIFHEDAQRPAQAMLDSVRGGRIEVGEEAVVVELHAEVEEVFELDEEQAEAGLTTEEREQLIQLWETWDALLVRLLVTIAAQPLHPEDRQILIEVLLDTRSVFIAALDRENFEKDFVRLQFVQAWQQLAPVFRRQLYRQPSASSLGYLAFFTAADALAVFDRMGPTVGMEISQQGLLRLAGMLVGTQTTLPYSSQLDKQLRELLQLPPMEEEVDPLDELQEIDIPAEELDVAPLSQLLDFFLRPAYGAEPPNFAEILQWKPPKDNVAEYMARVKAVLADSSAAVLSRGGVPSHLQHMFTRLIPALAWQESCFRQFVEKKNKLTYLLSYNQTSVGLMQINERVWRGIYDRGRLRWDIRYNALAGCEIVDLYLRKYALKDPVWGKGADTNLLSRVVYAMYNGGPGEYRKFLAREKTGKHYRSDLLFAEKLQWVVKNDWQHVAKCF